MTRVILIGLCLVAAAVGAGALGWVIWYRSGLRPTLVLTMPAEECREFVFDLRDVAAGRGVERICQENGISDGPVFAVRGRTVVRFVPIAFHAVHGRLEFAQGEEHTVYFYRYRRRYRIIIHAP